MPLYQLDGTRACLLGLASGGPAQVNSSRRTPDGALGRRATADSLVLLEMPSSALPHLWRGEPCLPRVDFVRSPARGLRLAQINVRVSPRLSHCPRGSPRRVLPCNALLKRSSRPSGRRSRRMVSNDEHVRLTLHKWSLRRGSNPHLYRSQAHNRGSRGTTSFT